MRLAVCAALLGGASAAGGAWGTREDEFALSLWFSAALIAVTIFFDVINHQVHHMLHSDGGHSGHGDAKGLAGPGYRKHLGNRIYSKFTVELTTLGFIGLVIWSARPPSTAPAPRSYAHARSLPRLAAANKNEAFETIAEESSAKYWDVDGSSGSSSSGNSSSSSGSSGSDSSGSSSGPPYYDSDMINTCAPLEHSRAACQTYH
jgi:hypothetical protein